MKLKDFNVYYIFLAIIVASLMLLVIFTRFERVIIIKSKEGYGVGRGRNQLVTDNVGRIYNVDNTFILMHFTGAEIFGNLEVGKRYKIKGYGVRIPMLGMFPNIISYNPV